jgi:hypothetical protein
MRRLTGRTDEASTLLFCWTFVPMIIGFVEGLVLLATSSASFAAKYGTA